MIELKHVSKFYQDNKVLKNINYKFNNNGLYMILGKSGSGKSTLLNIIGLLDKPTYGNVYFDDKKIKNIDEYHLNEIGFVYQNYNLFENMSVYDNINIIFNNKNIDDILKELNIYQYKNTLVKNLSGGEKQRVAIARAIVKKPKILLCDEPTGALDSKSSNNIMNILKELSRDMLVIVVTHDEVSAKYFGDYIIHIKDGKILDKPILKNNIKKNNILYKYKVSLKNIFKIVINNFKEKKKRNILIILAFSLGLLSLELVLGITNGFSSSINDENNNELSKYPIYISESSDSLTNELDIDINNNNYLSTYEDIHYNEINNDYLEYLNNLDDYIKYKIYTYNVDDKYLISVDNNLIYNDFKYIVGKSITKSNEVILLANNNKIDKNILKSIGLYEDKYEYNDLLNYEFIINNQKYKIVGIANNDDNIYPYGIYFYKLDLGIPNEIYLYSNNSKNKKQLINRLNFYEDIHYLDYADTIKSLSNTLIKSIKIILLCFSVMTLLVSSLMISIVTYISVLENKKMIGILSSLGLKKKYIKLIFVLESVILCLIASLISLFFIKLIGCLFNYIINNFIKLNNVFLLDYKYILLIILVSIFIGIISSLLPTRNINKLNIINVINDN